MEKPLRILVLEDKATDAELLIREVERAGFIPKWRRVETEADFLAELANAPDLILSDYSLPHFDGLRAVTLVRKRGLDIPFILVSGTVGEEAAVESMKLGADDYLLKDRTARLGPAIGRVLEAKRLRTEHKQAEERINASRKEVSDLKAALDEHAIVAITDQQGKITYVNDKFCAISKYSRDELLGQDHRIINSACHSKEFMRDLWTTITRGGVWKGEIRNRAKDGSFYWVDNTIFPFLNAEGKPYQFISIRADVTARKQVEADKAKLDQRVCERTAELEATSRDLTRRNEEIQNFYHTLCHELKTPLTSAREFISIVKDGLEGPVNAKQSEYLGYAQESCDHLTVCVDDLLDATRLETGKLAVHLKRASLADLVTRVVMSLNTAAAAKKIKIVCETEAGLPQVSLDEVRIAQVITNLVTTL